MPSSQELIDACACTRLRTAARLITRAYDEALSASGLNASQLAILAAVDVGEASSIAELSKQLSMDRTTLSRNLRPLERSRWIQLGPEGWKRSKTVRLTADGRHRLKRAATLWDKAQADFLRRFGKSDWERVDADLRKVARLL